ncbi:hypothetical protein J2W49_003503 [Hydrogenophaga palleronii]|uniref:Transposase DDE domain-containing protein n=1 Tax=Hydrogenophaga palleronii TaxID=65655 RepID=A0ABU1WQF4_9BURK|nr:hypothetical protein [Hydrogenophaga palleronii]
MTEPKGRYKSTNWAEYNAALKARGSLTIWLDKGTYEGESYRAGGYGLHRWCPGACERAVVLTHHPFHPPNVPASNSESRLSSHILGMMRPQHQPHRG